MRKRIADYIWNFIKKHHTCDHHWGQTKCNVCSKPYDHIAALTNE